MKTETGYPHISLDAHGRPVIDGTRMKVTYLIEAQQAHGWSPEEIRWQHPDLSLAQIHGAFTYYHDHREAMDQEMLEAQQFVERQRDQSRSDSPVLKKLQERGLR